MPGYATGDRYTAILAYPVPLRADSNPEIQRTLADVDSTISEGVLLPRELDLLLAMIRTKLPAFRVNL